MSTQYFAKASHVMEHIGFSRIPRELIEQARSMEYGGKPEQYFVVGTRFGNPSSKSEYFLLEYNRRLLQKLAESIGRSDYPKSDSEAFSYLTDDDFGHIVDSGMPYFSKYSDNGLLLLHDKLMRFYWHTAGREFWERLPRNVQIENFHDTRINTLGDLLDALYGPSAYMDAIENTRLGTYKDDPTQFPSWWINK